MAKKTKARTTSAPEGAAEEETINLSSLMSTSTTYKGFAVWLVGDTPLITHAWSEKAKREMLQKQLKSTKSGKEARSPEDDFVNSLYEMGEEDGEPYYGFPVTGIKNAILSSAHKDKGVARTTVQSALWLNADMVRVRPALAGAICDLPLVRIYGSDPEMREDMVRIGSGLQKKANLAYRGQFTFWAMRISGRFNPAVLTISSLFFLINESGTGIGIGEWRNERKGIFGGFHLASMEEHDAWTRYAAGKGPLPERTNDYELEAAE